MALQPGQRRTAGPSWVGGAGGGGAKRDGWEAPAPGAEGGFWLEGGRRRLLRSGFKPPWLDVKTPGCP